MLTTVQDLGRLGYQRYGMVVGGAMDLLALRLGNILLGNPENEAGLECTVIGPALMFRTDQLIALTGGDLSPRIDDLPVVMWKPLFVKAGSRLTFGKLRYGCRCYICFYGGLDIPLVMQSRSTYLPAKIGGLLGRALENQDTIGFRSPYSCEKRQFNWHISPKVYANIASKIVRVIKGPHIDQFDGDSLNAFFSSIFTVDVNSNRMGYRLLSSPLTRKIKKEILSSAVTLGTIQVPPEGTPIILLSDRPTTGGYPVIAQVASIDIPIIVQKMPHEKIQFEMITLEEAQLLVRLQHKQISQLKRAIAIKYGK